MKLTAPQISALKRVASTTAKRPRRGENVALLSLQKKGLVEAGRIPASSPHHYDLTDVGIATLATLKETT
jgi:hypothetical protein